VRTARTGEVVAGRWEIRGVVGNRPLGMMYRALDREVGVEVALRLLGPSLLPDAGARQAFVDRVARGKAMSHPSLVKLHDVFGDEEQEEVVVAVQWAPGSTLAERIRLGVPPEEGRRILKQVYAAVAHAHQHGVVLGDVRTDTVVAVGETVKVATVGIGAAVPRDLYLAAVRPTATFARLPPEVRAGRPVEPRSDIYSLAVLCVELLTGAPPDKPLTVRGAPAEAVALLAQALAEDPQVRPLAVDVFGDRFDALLSGVKRPPPRARKITQPPEPAPPPPQEAPTRQVHEDELEEYARRGRRGAITRRIDIAEIERLRERSTETEVADAREITMEADEAADEELALERRPPSAEDAAMTERVTLADEADLDDSHTVPVARIDIDAPPEDEAETPAPQDEDTNTHRVPREPAVVVESELEAATLPKPRAEAAPVEAVPVESSQPSPDGARKGESTVVARPTKVRTTVRVAPLPPPAAPSAEPPPRPSPPPRVEPPPRPPEPPARVEPPRPEPPPRPAPPAAQPGWPPAPRPVPEIPVATVLPERSPTPEPLLLTTPKAAPATMPPPLAVPVQPKRNLALLWGALALVVAGGAVGGIYWYLHRQGQVAAQAIPTPPAPAPIPVAAPAPPPPPTPVAAPAPQPPVATPAEPPATESAAPPKPTHHGACTETMVPVGHVCMDAYEYPGQGKPRTAIDADDAARLCKSRGARLCTDREFEAGCRGTHGASYPYGNSYDAKRCNTAGGAVAVVGSFAGCRSASGAMDMSGNVAEWVMTSHGPAQKGGSAETGNPAGRCSTTNRDGKAGDLVGFRCCADLH
jgi:serine/threonine-protein kinase